MSNLAGKNDVNREVGEQTRFTVRRCTYFGRIETLDLEQLRDLEASIRGIRSVPGLYHCVRTPRPGERCESTPRNVELASGWTDFLGAVETFDHGETVNESGTHTDSCFFGCREKLDDFTALAAAVHCALRLDENVCASPVRDARARRDRWTMLLYQLAGDFPRHIFIDGLGGGDYSSFGLNGPIVSNLFDNHPFNFDPADELFRHMGKSSGPLGDDRRSVPAYIYAALRTDLFSATLVVLRNLIDEIDGGVRQGVAISISPNSVFEFAGEDEGAEPWPPDGGWHFREGEFAFAGVQVSLTEKRRELLKALARSRRRWNADELREEFEIERKSLRSSVSTLSALLREKFGLPADSRPIISEGRGQDLTYRIDSNLLRSGRFVPHRWKAKS